MKIKIEKGITPEQVKNGREPIEFRQQIADAMKKLKVGESFQLNAKSHEYVHKYRCFANLISGCIRLLLDKNYTTAVRTSNHNLTVRIHRIK